MRERDRTIDCLKGYACLLVVLDHVIAGIYNNTWGGVQIPIFCEPLRAFVSSFHVPLFMFLSGYLYKLNGGWEAKGGRIRFIEYKLLNLGIPYLVFSTVYIIINSMVPGVNTQSKLIDIVWIWRTPVAQYWFIYALLVLFMLFTTLSGSMTNWQITLLLLMMNILAPVFDVSYGSFASGVSMGVAFGLGTIMPSLIIDGKKRSTKIIVIIIHLVFEFLIIHEKWNGLNISCFIEQIFGIAASIAFISLVIQSSKIMKILLFINKYSLVIYLTHTIFTAGSRIILNKFGVANYWVQLPCGMLAGVMIPVIGGWMVSKSPILDFFLHPSKSIKRMNSAKRITTNT